MHSFMQAVRGHKSKERKSDHERRKSSRIKQNPKKMSEITTWSTQEGASKIYHSIYEKENNLIGETIVKNHLKRRSPASWILSSFFRRLIRVTVKSDVFEDTNQFILAGSVLLMIISCVSLVFTIKTVVPGLHSRHFQPTNCTVVDSIYNGNVMCPVTNLSDRGCTPKVKCLEIFVKTTPNYGNKPAYGRFR